MPRHTYQHRVFRVKVQTDAGDYSLAALVNEGEWKNADHLGKKGWEFVAFVPKDEVLTIRSFSKGGHKDLDRVQCAVFRRQIEEGDDVDWNADESYLARKTGPACA